LGAVKKLEKTRRDISEHKRFVALCREFEELTEKLTEMEHGSEVDAEKKNAQVIIEQDQEVSRILKKAAEAKTADLRHGRRATWRSAGGQGQVRLAVCSMR